MSRQGRGHVIEHKSQIPRLVILVFALAGLVASLIVVYLLAPNLLDIFQKQELATNNRTWITRAWTESDRTNEEVAATVEILEDNGIKVVYLQTGSWHGQTGEYIELPYAQNFVQRFRKNTGSIQLYVWVSITSERLFDPDSRQKLIDFAAKAVLEQGFVGVHLQALSVPDNSQDYIELLRDLRIAIGQQAVLSVTVPPNRTPADPDVPSSPAASEGLTWSPDYKQRVALNVDEMVLMAHASGLDQRDDYRQWMAYQVATYAELIQRLEIATQFIVALPTYPAEIGHDPEVENVETAIQGLLDGIRRARDAGQQVSGVGLYPWEETDLFELETYWNQWVSGQK
jgi:hypothetical protein